MFNISLLNISLRYAMKIKPAIFLLFTTMIAPTAFADQRPSGDSIKINDGYPVAAPDSCNYFDANVPIEKKGPINFHAVEFDTGSVLYWDKPLPNVASKSDILCWYEVNNSSSDGLLIIARN